MKPNNILSASLIDLIFDGRNKDYGAYELRKTYEQRIKKALIITFSIAVLVLGGTAVAGTSKKQVPRAAISGDYYIEPIPPDEKIPEPPPKQETPPEEVQVKTEKYVEMEIVDDDKQIDPPPTQESLATAKIGLDKIDGIDDNKIAAPEISKGVDKGIVQQKIEKEPDLPITIVEVDAKFIGDWHQFLLRNLRGDVASNNNAPPGRYTVLIQFVVDKEGNVSDIKPLTKHGYGLEEEAIRVLKNATKWEPAIQNGYQVKAYRKQPITFDVLEE